MGIALIAMMLDRISWGFTDRTRAIERRHLSRIERSKPLFTALVGSKGLGQSVYIALSKADTGLGMVAGLGMALIAIIADRIIQSWCAKRKDALGLS